MPRDSVLQSILQLTSGDVPPVRNLGTYVSAPNANESDWVLAAWSEHNLINRAEYVGLTAIENQCLSVLKSLWHAPDQVAGCSATGSTEAALIAASALLHRWRARGGIGRPNLVLGPAAHVCWRKFCALWDVEPRSIPLVPHHDPIADPTAITDGCDLGTIGVVATLGSPEFGLYDPVGDIAASLDGLQQRTGLDISVHVDAASGGFVAPFLQPDQVWDFRLERVTSINASGHKYGLTRPSVGWLLWRAGGAAEPLLSVGAPYIGTGDPEPTLSFSRSVVPVLEQYMQLMERGRRGYTVIHRQSQLIAAALADRLAQVPALRVIGTGADLPVVSFTSTARQAQVTELAALLAAGGWSIPVYRLRAPMDAIEAGRIVVRADLSPELATRLVDDVAHAVAKLIGSTTL